MDTPQQPMQHEQPAPLWLQRLSLLLLVLTCIYIGLMLLVLPWTSYWKDNHLLAMLPEAVKDWLTTGPVKGVISGLGLLDVWIGLSELTQWRGRRG